MNDRASVLQSDGAPSSWRRLLKRTAIVLALVAVGLFLLLTDGSPLVGSSPPPSAEQVGAARAAVRQFRVGQASAGNSLVRFDSTELGAIGALASNGFEPDRLLAQVRGDTITVVGSHRLPLWRWLNVSVISNGGGAGFPPVRVVVGSVTFPRGASRFIFETARRLALARGMKLPPLDRMVRGVKVGKGTVSAMVSLPPGSGILSQVGDNDDRPAPAAVGEAYCRLVKLQTEQPTTRFSTHVNRAFAMTDGPAATPMSNRAAFIALAMLTVDPRVAELAGVPPALIAKCRMEPIDVMLNGRADLPKHWALSAALDVATGTQFSQAVGEWKELADSISKQSQFAVGDPSGFSFLDLASDRAGFLIAGLAVAPGSAAQTARSLAQAQSQDLLPPSLMTLEDGMSNAAFVRKYGSTDDPRFLAAVAQIDAELARSARQRSGPLASLPAN